MMFLLNKLLLLLLLNNVFIYTKFQCCELDLKSVVFVASMADKQPRRHDKKNT